MDKLLKTNSVDYKNDKIFNINDKIFLNRGLQVMIDRDLAELYGVETKRLNEQVKRNIERFPDEFHFQLSKNEKDELVANCDRFENHFGASLKDTGKKLFAFSKLSIDVKQLLTNIGGEKRCMTKTL